jgi:SAM-dependent methyltransferase
MNVDIRVDQAGNAFELRPMICPTCRIDSQRTVGYRGGKYHRYGLGIESRIVECTQCRLLFSNPFPFPLAPQQLYGDPDKYFGESPSAEKVLGNRKIVQKLASYSKRNKLTLLDVGSGRGEMLVAASQEGLEATGIEFSEAMIEHARTQYGLTVLRKSIEELADGWQGEPFDAVVLNAVLEHVYDPDSMLRSASRLTRPGSVIYIDVPREPNLLTYVGNAFNRVRGNKAVYNLQPTWPPFHVFGFSPHSLTVLLRKHGFRILELVVWSAPFIPARDQLKDQIKAFLASQIIKIGNLTGTASNMCLYAVREAFSTSYRGHA